MINLIEHVLLRVHFVRMVGTEESARLTNIDFAVKTNEGLELRMLKAHSRLRCVQRLVRGKRMRR